MSDTIWLFVGFNVFVLAMLALDLGVFHRKAHVVAFRESITWTMAWVGLAMVFNAGILLRAGDRLSFKAGYRFLEGGADNDEVYTFALVHYVAAGVVIRF